MPEQDIISQVTDEQPTPSAPSEVDPFSYITGSQEQDFDPFPEALPDVEPQPATAQEQETPSQEEAPLDPEAQRIRDWQSKYDRLTSEFNQFKQAAEDNNVLQRYMQEDPALAQQLYGVIEQSLSGKGSRAPGGQPAAAESPEMPQEPTMPERPADYSEQDALMEPQSSSFTHRQQMEEYYRQKQSYDLQAAMTQMKQMVAPIYQTFEQQQEQQQQRQYITGILNAFTESGLPQDESQKVVEWASSYEITPEDVAALYKMRNGSMAQPAPTAQSAERVNTLNQRNERLTYPLPAATGGAQTATPPRSSQDTIFDDLKALDTAANPWA